MPEPLYKIDLRGEGLVQQDGETVLIRLPPGYKLHVTCPFTRRLAIYPMIARGQREAREAIIDQELAGTAQRAFETTQRVPLAQETRWIRFCRWLLRI